MAPTQNRKRTKSPKKSSAKRAKTQSKPLNPLVAATALLAAIAVLLAPLGFKDTQQAVQAGYSIPDPNTNPKAACDTIIASIKTGSVAIDDSVTEALNVCVEYDGPGAEALLEEISTLGKVKPD